MAWGDTEHLLAHTVDRLGVLIWQLSTRWRAPNTAEPPKPRPVRRPGHTEDTGKRVGIRELVRMMKGAKGAKR